MMHEAFSRHGQRLYAKNNNTEIFEKLHVAIKLFKKDMIFAHEKGGEKMINAKACKI